MVDGSGRKSDLDLLEARLAALLRTVVVARDPVVPTDEPTRPLCWHCCHDFEGPRLQFPVTYDNRTDTFRVVGAFCSWECVKAYDRDIFAPRVSSGKTANIRYYYKKVTGRSIGNVRSAPPRVALKAFGGKLGIEDFRKEFDAGLSYELDVTRLIPVVPLQRGASEPAGAARHEAPTSVDFADATYRSDNLRLKRPKPLAHAGRNTLERVLGLNSLTKKK